ncbi:bacterial bifunctional deaminase-reductase [Cristinia sonorae]|uniref:2,5-diamino-6-ribosylamino-4(3H)-pyrimidinone 5'-phosphate reductase n=1 Tax=Cristinia sonorae TaxID=1940300 RepID=A0A8K0UMT7_9AGAR|nr:bacterial bifunctional deaminase-reductase [Cristinia sonorae]
MNPPSILLDTLFPPGIDLEHVSRYTPDDDKPVISPVSDDHVRPWVTLTFAQSLDARIAGEAGKQLILSGKESMVMTHWMRSMHDAILVGIGTALNDNPQLNTRHLPPLPEDAAYKYNLPRPVILDTHLRLRSDCKLLNNYKAGVGRRPLVVTSAYARTSDEADAWTERKANLETAGARVIEIEAVDGGISISSLLTALRTLGIRSLMVEGGASVIKSFLASTQSHQRTVDAIIVTVAPVFVGKEGVGYGENLLGSQIPAMKHVKTELFGADAVIALTTNSS